MRKLTFLLFNSEYDQRIVKSNVIMYNVSIKIIFHNHKITIMIYDGIGRYEHSKNLYKLNKMYIKV